MYNVATIGPLDEPDRGAIWDIRDSLREERRIAVDVACDAHPELSYGKWTASTLFETAMVHVGYEQQRDDAGGSWWGKVNVLAPLDVDGEGYSR